MYKIKFRNFIILGPVTLADKVAHIGRFVLLGSLLLTLALGVEALFSKKPKKKLFIISAILIVISLVTFYYSDILAKFLSRIYYIWCTKSGIKGSQCVIY